MRPTDGVAPLWRRTVRSYESLTSGSLIAFGKSGFM